MKQLSIVIILLLLSRSVAISQVSVNEFGDNPDGSAMLDIQSTTKGVLIPRMTLAQIQAITDPADGLLLFCTTDSKFYSFIETANKWKEISFGSGYINMPFNCGTTVNIDHLAGSVAPVNKTVNYATVTGIPGEPSKCWISSNLGASNQASSVDDATEAAAGWYWQFNKMQGFKHDGTTRTPASSWITLINENSNWIAANDPCNLELGNNWRIPTESEWTNVDASGGWTNWNGPWDSDLKMHAAGALNAGSGALNNRGVHGYSWNSNQASSIYSNVLNFNTSSCGLILVDKSYGFSVRCIHD